MVIPNALPSLFVDVDVFVQGFVHGQSRHKIDSVQSRQVLLLNLVE